MPQNKALYNFIMLQCYTSVSKHKLSWGSWVRFLQSNVLCMYLLGEAPPTCCYHGDSLSLVSCLQRSEQDFSGFNSVGVQWDKKVGTSTTLKLYTWLWLHVLFVVWLHCTLGSTWIVTHKHHWYVNYSTCADLGTEIWCQVTKCS